MNSVNEVPPYVLVQRVSPDESVFIRHIPPLPKDSARPVIIYPPSVVCWTEEPISTCSPPYDLSKLIWERETAGKIKTRIRGRNTCLFIITSFKRWFKQDGTSFLLTKWKRPEVYMVLTILELSSCVYRSFLLLSGYTSRYQMRPIVLDRFDHPSGSCESPVPVLNQSAF